MSLQMAWLAQQEMCSRGLLQLARSWDQSCPTSSQPFAQAPLLLVRTHILPFQQCQGCHHDTAEMSASILVTQPC
jgi:hypothetical protein